MKTQEEYAHEIDEIVRRDVESCQSDWFIIDKEILSNYTHCIIVKRNFYLAW